MKSGLSRLTGWCVLLALGACVAGQPAPVPAGDKISPQMRSGSPELRAYKLVDWTAPDDRTLILNTADRALYQARFKTRCTGLRLADTIAFVVPATPDVEKYDGVVLPDGTRCSFKALERLTVPDAHDKDGAN